MFKCGRAVRAVALGTQQLSEELTKILPVFSQHTRSVPERVSFSSVAVASARGAAFEATATHSPDCPVNARRLPLGLIAKEPGFLKKPCEVCLAKRTHFLSSELFSRQFASKCHGPVNGSVPPSLEKAAIKSFGSVANMHATLLNFCTGSLSPGRTWFVCRPDGSLAVVALPGSKIPQTLGLWPLAVFDLSEYVLCQFIEAHTTATTVPASQAAAPPTWSRAARNPGSILGAHPHGTTEQQDLGSVRRAVAEAALGTTNWSFVDEQLSRATAYFQSEGRVAKQKSARSAQERHAAKDALKHLNAAENATLDDSDDFHVETTVKQSNTDAPEKSEEKSEEKATTTVSAAETQTPTAAAQESQGAAETDPVTVQLPDGTWEYRYKNGDVTCLHSDGKKVFKTQGLITTVFPNTDTLFEYENKTTILDRADGVRVTTFPDGRRTEERIK